MQFLKTIFRCTNQIQKTNLFKNLSYKIDIFPALSDNYMYLLTDNKTKCCAAIDPVQPHGISLHIKSHNLNLTHILITHHHWDHSGGTVNLLSEFENQPINVVGFDNRIEALNCKIDHNETVQIGDVAVRCMFTPCHTSGHMSYFVGDTTDGDNNECSLFSGDALFVAGCGWFFEGTAADMYRCVTAIVSLPLTTSIYCGHEYTVKNLEFALSIEPENDNVIRKLEWAREQRKRGLPTIPTTLSDELKTNPYLRMNEERFKIITGESDPISIIRVLREMKDVFK